MKKLRDYRTALRLGNTIIAHVSFLACLFHSLNEAILWLFPLLCYTRQKSNDLLHLWSKCLLKATLGSKNWPYSSIQSKNSLCCWQSILFDCCDHLSCLIHQSSTIRASFYKQNHDYCSLSPPWMFYSSANVCVTSYLERVTLRTWTGTYLLLIQTLFWCMQLLLHLRILLASCTWLVLVCCLTKFLLCVY